MPGEDHGWEDEAARVAHRRRALDIPVVPGNSGRNRALALSGGGIRSATFCLGVMQALAEAPVPKPAGDADGAPPAVTGAHSLLAQFDYLSTVSGGGYIGSFFTSLFVPGRLRRGTSPLQAAQDAYRTLQYEPPGRIRTGDFYGDAPGRAAVAWLRENGRYLTPTGAGDNLYAAAVIVRNWMAMQYVIGSALLVLLAALALGLHVATGTWLGLGQSEMDLLHDARQAFNEDTLAIWWSAYLWLPVVSALLFVLPPGIAFWLVYPTSDDPQQPVRALNGAVLLAVVIGALFLAASLWFQTIEPNMRIAYACFVIGMAAWLGVAACMVMLMPAPRTVTVFRVRATRALRGALGLTAALAALGLADTAARTCYLYTFMAPHPWAAIGPAGALGGLVWLVRYGATLFDNGKKGATDSAWRTLAARLPMSLLAGVVAALVAVLVFVLWSWIVLWVRWDGGEPVDWHVFGKAWTTAALVTLTLLALCMAIVVGRFAGFLNLSTLQSFYAARLTRAYLGASNGNRFSTPAADRAARQRFSVAEPAPDDALSLNDYYDPRVLAPLHLINVTLNQTVDPAEQLVQRDRKGKPLCIGPGPALAQPGNARQLPADVYVRFTVDGQLCCAKSQGAAGIATRSVEMAQARTVGDWIAISGAAISTGLGRASTLGTSLLLGLANLRLGIWWPSTMAEGGSCATGAGTQRPDMERRLHPALGMITGLFRTQYYLGCELAARFHGTRRRWQYLSDGGHFENTAVYELLRPERRVGLIVVCDCGCDGDYRFGDLANLIRLARIDFGLEIVVDHAAASDPALGTVFGTPDDFAADAPPEAQDKVAILLNVHVAGQAGAPDGAPVTRIVLIKPRLTPSAPADVRQYGALHPSFPQEGTADQFFDEAQWESYRALGVAIGRRIAGGAVAQRLFG
ncbi:patatin-like phospholipase family protein [Cupriavidus sp. BIS7]|uniref:patatin-like phospholipase family protein n=1 Tax=Cupriavidus sp. BIS7 TaxID=1217718 RepID=UPI00031BFDE7|nr:patatin-like phospholipase family protein [Cupriavidus sp. BIS7]